MNNKVYAIIAVAILAISSAGIAFYALNKDGDDAEGATVTDALGRAVEIPEEIDSIFCREAGSLRLVSYFSSVEKVKGLEAKGMFNELDDQTYYLVYKERFESLPRVALDAESIIQHDPDIIITSMTDVVSVDNLEKQTNITVYAVNGGYQIGEDYYQQIQNLGKLFGEAERAQQLIDGTKALIDDISSKVTSVSDSKAYACGMFYYGNAKFIKGTGNYQPFDLSYVYNVMPEMENKEPYQVAKETVISYNPDVIFIDSIEIDSILAEISGDIASYDNINAIKNSGLHSTMVYKCYFNNWENQLVNAFYVADVLNGDLYTWDFETKADEVMELYYPGMDVTYAEIAAVQGGCSAVTLG